MLLEPHLIDPSTNAYFDSAASASAPTVSVGVAVGNRNILSDKLMKAQFLLQCPVCQIGVFVAQDRKHCRGVELCSGNEVCATSRNSSMGASCPSSSLNTDLNTIVEGGYPKDKDAHKRSEIQ